MKAIMRDEQEMRDSGVKWMGKIPRNWDIFKLKNIVKITSGNYLNKDDFNPNGDYAVIGSNGEIGRYDNVNVSGTVLITGRVGTVGTTNLIDSAWVTDNALILDSENINCLKYLYYLLPCLDYRLMLAGTAQPLITATKLKNQFIPNIGVEIQQAIANYLDDHCSKIDAIIAEAKASIEEYKELKQAVITQAVTLGIKKNRPLKDTNILWIGKMPCDWQLAELKFFASIKSGITLGQKYPAGAKLVEMPYLRVANVQGEYVDLSDVKTIQVLPEEVDKYRLEAGVVLMTEGGDRDKLGRGCVWHGEITPCLHQNHIFALTTKSDKLLPEYFSHVTTSEVARCYFDYTAKKTTNLANTNSSTIMNFRLPIPPLEEQREIVQYLDKRIKTLNDMISEKQSLIEDLESYKKSLIYEVVTGKRKVVA